ncbi:MAG: trypsin-like peptidase domain-containing protein [Verrucomicrobia bacterium]|nr:trypsin-like peptidase domain-containing protein [Verrucomicrobiota bacterium]
MALRFGILLLGALLPPCFAAEESKDPPAVAPTPVTELTKRSLDSVVVVCQQGRGTDIQATGTGFVVSPDGLIATNAHVINFRSEIEVELRDGTKYPVTEVHASDHRLDLALIKIKPEKPLPALKLGNSDSLVQGQPVVALGNPRGLKFSVVEGIVSGFREDVGDNPFRYLQLAIPVEEGNSGGPVLNLQGEVQGIVTLKSMVTRNLGFAMPVNALKLLLEKPNPIPIASWATIGRLDPQRWIPVMGADWSQRAGRILVSGTGSGFGGRALCLQTKEPSETAYELAVEVKLDDESGAAGLVFAADGADAHYGFYPSGGRIRLTRFEGPDVQSWTILGQYDAPSYRPGDWNQIRVRIEEDRLIGFVNGEEIASVEDSVLRGGRVGLCKFRQTSAEFRRFRVGKDLDGSEGSARQSEALAGKIEEYLRSPSPDRAAILETLLSAPKEVPASLETVRLEMNRRLDRLKTLTESAVAQIVGTEVATALGASDAGGNLFRAGLLVARLDNPDIETQIYEDLMDSMAARIRAKLPAKPTEEDIVKATLRFMFEESGFHASRLDSYYHKSNSFLNEVLDDREGIPITLCIVFIELGKRCGAKSVHGVGLPGHFVAGFTKAGGERQLVDVYESGAFLDGEAAARIVFEFTEREMTPEDLKPMDHRAIIGRLLRNLIEQEKQRGTPLKAVPYLEVALKVNPDDAAARFDRALLRYQEGDVEGTKSDLRWLLQADAPGINQDRLRQFYDSL